MRACTDTHSHILPGVDDGSRSVAESLEMLRMEAAQGIRRVVATPHFYAGQDNPERFLKRRAVAWDRLQKAMEEQELPRITLGAEVYYFPGMSESDALSELTIGNTRMLLLEMPHSPWTASMYREMESIYVKRGITPVIAHIDRYIAPFRTHGIPARLAELPVLVQANASFFLDWHTAPLAFRLLKEDRIHLLGSDCHDLSARKPNLGEALRRIENRLGKDVLRRIGAYEDRLFL